MNIPEKIVEKTARRRREAASQFHRPWKKLDRVGHESG
jgi:hypothetical protein